LAYNYPEAHATISEVQTIPILFFEIQ